MVNEDLANVRNQISQAQVNEQVRHNKASEQLSGVDLNIQSALAGEQHRHNVNQEQLDKARVRSQEVLQQSQANLNDVNASWAAILNSKSSNLSASQINEISNRIDKLQSDIDRAELQNNVDVANSIFRGIQTLSDAINKFRRK